MQLPAPRPAIRLPSTSPRPRRRSRSVVLSIDTTLTISGPGAANLAISGNHSVQVFFIAEGVTVNIFGITVKYGSGKCGGGIENAGTLTGGKQVDMCQSPFA